jgi:sulfatase modifying factor 1
MLGASLTAVSACHPKHEPLVSDDGRLDAANADTASIDALADGAQGPDPKHDGAPIREEDAPHRDVVIRDNSIPPDPPPDPPTGCHRDPYLPDHYEPPCDAPTAVPSCSAGWCTIEPGCYIMGSPWCEWGRAKSSTNPVQVRLSHGFQMAEFELAQREWESLGLPNPSGLMADGTGDCSDPTCPVGNVTWFEALEFANRYSKEKGLPACYVLAQCSGEMGKGMLCNAVRFSDPSTYDCLGYRLPTGAEWEYAARAGSETSVYTGDIPWHSTLYNCYEEPVLEDIAWYCANAGPFTHPGGQKKPNGWGLFDMIGNAGEWVASLGPTNTGYGDGPFVDYGAALDLVGLLDATVPYLVQYRSGGWNIWPSFHRAGRASAVAPNGTGPGIGLRLVRTLVRKEGAKTSPGSMKQLSTPLNR